ncbi:MAG: ABC transporter ATP-binding protein [Ndongobacter sp.]|nr:ABC transporter ATP-binding protein [Ndongobacter sp.]
MHEAEGKKPVVMEVRNVSFAYGQDPVLRQVSLRIQAGLITTIMGANGSGKSTLFYLMTKNLIPKCGQIFFEEEDIRGMDLRMFARKVSIVQQSNTASDDISVRNLVAFGRTPYRRMLKSETEEDSRMIEWAMEVTGTESFKHREMGQLSGGQRQRVWIAMALAQNARVLFLDEPTTYLDIRYQIELLELIRKLNREYGITIIMVLHDINQAIHYSDWVVGLKEGAIVTEGKPEQVITTESLKELYGVSLSVEDIRGKKYVFGI